MDHPSDNKKQLKVVQESDDAAPLIPEDEIVKVLHPERPDLGEAKSHEPEVSEILGDDTEIVDPELEWGGFNKIPPIGWFVLMGLIILALCGWAILSLFKAQPEIQESNKEKQEILVDFEKENKDVQHILHEMEQCVTGYLAAENIQSMLPYVRHPKRVEPLMKHYYQDHKIQPGRFRQFTRIRPLGLENHSFIFGKVKQEDGSSRKMIIEQLPDNHFKIDWESDVCYLPMKWETYISQHPTQTMDLRVLITPDTFYAFEFRDESEFQSYKITTRDSDQHLFGFAKKGSRANLELQRIIRKNLAYGGGKSEPAILRLRFPEKSPSKNCVWIDAVIAPRWTYVTSPTPPTREK